MVDMTGLSAEVALLQAQALGGTVITLGDTLQPGSLAAGIRGLQADIANGVGANLATPVDFSTYSSAATIIKQSYAAANPVTITGTPVTTATQNMAYTGFSATGHAGTSPYTYSIATGALPTGITLDPSTGAVAGTPTVVETQTGIVIRATDSVGNYGDLAPFQIDVSA